MKVEHVEGKKIIQAILSDGNYSGSAVYSTALEKEKECIEREERWI